MSLVERSFFFFYCVPFSEGPLSVVSLYTLIACRDEDAELDDVDGGGGGGVDASWGGGGDSDDSSSESSDDSDDSFGESD